MDAPCPEQLAHKMDEVSYTLLLLLLLLLRCQLCSSHIDSDTAIE